MDLKYTKRSTNNSHETIYYFFTRVAFIDIPSIHSSAIWCTRFCYLRDISVRVAGYRQGPKGHFWPHCVCTRNNINCNGHNAALFRVYCKHFWRHNELQRNVTMLRGGDFDNIKCPVISFSTYFVMESS